MMVKRYFTAVSYMLVILIVTIPNISFAADIWSEPTYTEQWSEPTYTEPWSLPQTTEPWIPPSTTEQVLPTQDRYQEAKQNSEPSIYIRLQIGSKNAVVQDKDIQLDVAPSIVDGRTMVPIRFVGEALNATVGWEEKTQKATLSLKDKTIVLILGESTALVNGKQVKLDAPVTRKDGRTLVPLRFVSENLDLFVNYIAATQTIEITDEPLASEQPTNKTVTESPEQTKEAIVDFEKLYGTWYIWTPGAATNLYDKTTGDYVTHEYNKGADQGKITINENGTYSMTHAAWAKGKTVEGKWRLSFLAEINGERIQSIVLLNGITDVDWAVAPSDNGKIRLLYAMRWADGSAIWVFDSELYKK